MTIRTVIVLSEKIDFKPVVHPTSNCQRAELCVVREEAYVEVADSLDDQRSQPHGVPLVVYGHVEVLHVISMHGRLQSVQICQKIKTICIPM